MPAIPTLGRLKREDGNMFKKTLCKICDGNDVNYEFFTSKMKMYSILRIKNLTPQSKNKVGREGFIWITL